MRALVWLLLMVIASGLNAQGYPYKTIRMIVQFAPGGQGDIIARSLMARASETFKQTILVDNRPGAAGTIATEAAVRANPDGYTFILVSSGYATNAALYKLPFDPVTDVAPIALIGDTGMLVIVPPSLPVTTIKDLITHDKANPGRLNYGSSGTGSTPHLATELFNQMTGTSITHVPYKGNILALNDLLGGQIQVNFGNIANIIPLLKVNRVRGLAVTASRRAAGAPDIPTIAESVPGYEAVLWYAVLAPKALPGSIQARWNVELNRILQLPEIKERLLADGIEVVGGPPQRFRDVLVRDVAKWQRVVNAAHIKVGG